MFRKMLHKSWGLARVDCYTPCNTIPELWFLSPLDPCLYVVFITFLFSILTLTLNSVLGTPYAQPCPTFPIPCPLPIYPDQEFHNPSSDLLIPLLCSWPCTVPSRYKSEPPMYSSTGSNKFMKNVGFVGSTWKSNLSLSMFYTMILKCFRVPRPVGTGSRNNPIPGVYGRVAFIISKCCGDNDLMYA